MCLSVFTPYRNKHVKHYSWKWWWWSSSSWLCCNNSNHSSSDSDGGIITSNFGNNRSICSPYSNKDCKDIQFRTFEQSFGSNYSGKAVTIGTSQDEYSVIVDYFKVEDDFLGYTYHNNVGAKDPKGHVLLPGGETITITLQTQEGLSHVGGHVFLYDHKVSDCQILLGHVQDKDRMDLKIVSVEQNVHTENAKITVQVPDASDVVGKHFTKLGVQFRLFPEVQEYHLISHRVQVS